MDLKLENMFFIDFFIFLAILIIFEPILIIFSEKKTVAKWSWKKYFEIENQKIL